MNNATLLLLDRDCVASLLTHEEVLDAVREAFVLHSTGQGRSFPVVRERLAAGVFGIKSGDVESQRLLGFKAAGFWPANRGRGAEPHQATTLLFDPATGRPVCLMDGNRITALRTGAAGAIGLQWFSRPDSRTLTVFGTGVQARIHLEFALRVRSIARVIYHGHDGRRDSGFEAHLRALDADLSIDHSVDPNEAVRDADIVVTTTPGSGVLFDGAAVREGTHVNAVGADTRGKRELPAELLDRAEWYVDDESQSRTLGELQWGSASHRCVEIGDVLNGTATPTRPAPSVTVFDMTGLSLQDLTVARRLHANAQATASGTRIPWPY